MKVFDLSKKLTSYSFEEIYDPTKVGTVTVDSFSGLAKPTIGTPMAICTDSVTFESGSSSSITGTNGKIIGGRMYGDRAITSSKYVAGKTTAITDEANQIAADVNGDGSITAADAKEI